MLERLRRFIKCGILGLPRGSRMRPWEVLVLCAAMLFTIVSFAVSWQDTKHYGGSDLLSRLIGGYAMSRGFDPYFHSLEQAATFPLQTAGRSPGVHPCAYPPAMLWVYAWTTPLEYRQARSLWFGVEWLAMVTAILFGARLVPGRSARVLFIGFALVFFSGGTFWRLHVERGQYYGIVAAAMIVCSYLMLRVRRQAWAGVAGLLLGAAITWYPVILISTWMRALSGRWRGLWQIIIPAVTAILITLGLVAKFGPTPFQNYVTMVGYWRMQIFTGQDFTGYYVPPTNEPDISNKKPKKMKRSFERYTANSLKASPLDTTFSSAVLTAYYPRDTILTPEAGQRIINANNLLMVGYLVGFGSFLLGMSIAGRAGSPRLQLAAGLLMALMASHFVPVRWEYADIMYLPLLALLSPWLKPRDWLSALALGAVLTGFLVGNAAVTMEATWPGWWRVAGVLGGAHLIIVGAFLRWPCGSGLLAKTPRLLPTPKPPQAQSPKAASTGG